MAGETLGFITQVQSGSNEVIYRSLTNGKGNLRFVGSAVTGATDGTAYGRTPSAPFATLDYAIGQCTANNGDIILILPGHSESPTTATTFDIAGLTIRGVGTGLDRAEFTIAGTVDGFDVTADDVTIENIYFNESTAAATSNINIAAARCTLRNIHMDCGATDVDAITITAAGEVPTIEDCTVLVTADGPDSWIKFEGVIDRPTIRRNHIIGSDATNAYDDGVLDFNSQAVTNPLVVENYFSGNNATTTVIANGGSVVGNVYANNVYGSSATEADSVGTGDVSQILTELSGAAGIATFPTGAAPANGVSIAEGVRFISEAITDGAAFSQTVDPGGTARASVELVLADLGAMLAGTAGITTFPAAAAPANAVSIAEALRYVSEQQSIRYVTKTAAVLTNGLDLFTVTGTIAVKYLYLLCATANDATASTIQFNAVPTVGSATTLSAASASVANAAAGATITLAGTALATAALYAANGPNLIANPGTILVPAGVIDVVVGVGSTTGTWSAHLVYEPLSAGASVAAA